MIIGLPNPPMLITNLLAQIAFGLIAMTICLPSMQEWGALFGAAQAQVQLTFSGFVVAFGVFQLVYGPLSDRYGRKGVLVTGLALMALGSLVATLSGMLLMLGLALMGWDSPLAFTLPLMLLGAGHGFLMPPTLAGTVGVVPALAGSAAALAGLMQQLMGAVGAYSVGLAPHQGSRNLGWLMLGLPLCALCAHLALRRQRLHAFTSK